MRVASTRYVKVYGTLRSLVRRKRNAMTFSKPYLVAGSQNNRFFDLIALGAEGHLTGASVLSVTPGFLGGCAVAATGGTVAVGNTNGGQIAFYNVTNLAAPVKSSELTTTFAGIGAIDADGNYVLAGELDGSRIILIDISKVESPKIVSTLVTNVKSIGSLGLTVGGPNFHAAVGGPTTPSITIVNYSNLAAPQQQVYSPNLGDGYNVDVSGNTIAAGNLWGEQVVFLDITAAVKPLSPPSNVLPGITSISSTATSAICGSTNSANVTVVDLGGNPSPFIETINAGLGGGATVLQGLGGYFYAGAITGSGITRFNTDSFAGGLHATDSINSKLASISTLAVGVTPVVN